MTQAVYIVSAVRTPIGKFGGMLAELTQPDLGTIAVRAALERAFGLPLPPERTPGEFSAPPSLKSRRHERRSVARRRSDFRQRAAGGRGAESRAANRVARGPGRRRARVHGQHGVRVGIARGRAGLAGNSARAARRSSSRAARNR